MTRATITAAALAPLIVLVALVAEDAAPGADTATTRAGTVPDAPAAAPAPGAPSAAAAPSAPTAPLAPTAPSAAAAPSAPAAVPASSAPAAHAALLHGRVTTEDGTVYEGRLRFGDEEEALWGNYFNGYEAENPWADLAPLDRLPRERRSIEILGFEIAVGRRHDLGRPFMARFGDIQRLEARGRDLRVTLKSGTVFHLDRYAADDFADGVRVWDGTRGVVELGERRIRSIEFLPTAGDDLAAASGRPAGNGHADGNGAIATDGRAPGNDAAPRPLYGTVHTREGDFTGFVQWDREAAVGTDELRGRTADGEVAVRFDAVRSIARLTGEGALVTLHDGREIVLVGTRRGGNRGMYVDDPRYGRVLVSWAAFEHVAFGAGGTAPAYSDFPPGGPITGSVITRSGRRLAGRLVYDLDESETTETLDAPSRGVDYTIPFGLVASIAPLDPGAAGARGARVTLHGRQELLLEAAGDLASSNAGLLVLQDGLERVEYVPWRDVERVDLDRPAAMYPSGGPTGEATPST